MIELHDAEQSRALAAISPTGLGPVSRYGSMRLPELVDLYLTVTVRSGSGTPNKRMQTGASY